MSQPTYRLANHTCVVPLVQSWAAWWMTTVPAPASLHVHKSQIPLLKAYLQNPDFHARAAKDPALSGGTFVGISPERAGEVKALLQQTQEAQADRVKMAEALEDFQGWLMEEAKGQSLEPLYEKIPEPLRGLVELAYDYHNRAFLRVMEGGLYRSRYHKPELQSLRLLRLESDSSRPHLFTTPYLMQAGQLDWAVPFSEERISRLFETDLSPRPLGYLRDVLGPAVTSDEQLLPLLTEEPPATYTPWEGAQPRVRYLGHACALVEWKGVTVLVDPVISARPAGGGMTRRTFHELPPRIDYVLITHNHPDHLHIETLLRLRHRIGQLVVPRSGGMMVGDYSIKLLARSLGFQNVLELDTYESLPLPDGEIVTVPFLGEHGDVCQAKSSYVVRAGKQQMLFAADSMCVDDAVYRHMRQNLGTIQTVFMNTEIEGAPHTWTLEALFPKKRDRKLEKNRRCRGSNAAEGLRLLELVGASRLYNYAMGLEPWMENIIGPPSPPEAPRMKESDRLLAELRAKGLGAERLCGPTDLLLES
ncbi:MBL fold metallo-hydrolase [Archangium lansingense]|uniref:MBL fold metallo-hydrolase n=1 Tax=Archangium lansingense TaxID=2995310 RepID=A0ABT4AE83_9BACT|nr:MBL fold metallo-hydrolase [Archangium lansinium]MCY1079871.1 MBL fold metallo-hydrolase [Archangium lansinium]